MTGWRERRSATGSLSDRWLLTGLRLAGARDAGVDPYAVHVSAGVPYAWVVRRLKQYVRLGRVTARWEGPRGRRRHVHRLTPDGWKEVNERRIEPAAVSEVPDRPRIDKERSTRAVLAVLAGAGDAGMHQGAVARAADVTSSMAGRRLDELEAQGLVTSFREGPPGRRMRVCRLTPEGCARLRELGVEPD